MVTHSVHPRRTNDQDLHRTFLKPKISNFGIQKNSTTIGFFEWIEKRTRRQLISAAILTFIWQSTFISVYNDCVQCAHSGVNKPWLKKNKTKTTTKFQRPYLGYDKNAGWEALKGNGAGCRAASTNNGQCWRWFCMSEKPAKLDELQTQKHWEGIDWTAKTAIKNLLNPREG